MAERKAVNKYYPPDWDPSKGSLNKYRGQHPLRHRARKLKQGILIVRFEMPFNIFCGGCQAHIGQGTRFNAEKQQDGNYHSTKIWKFTMKCAQCKNVIVIKTDPKIRDYVVVSGGKRREERFEYSPEENAITLLDDEEREKIATDSMYALDHYEEQKIKFEEEMAPILDSLQKISESKKDDFALNSQLRKKMRKERSRVQKDKETYKSLSHIDLLKPNKEDEIISKNIKFKSISSASLKKQKIRTSTIFGKKLSDNKLLLKETIQKQLLNKGKTISSNDSTTLSDVIRIKKKTNPLNLLSQYNEE